MNVEYSQNIWLGSILNILKMSEPKLYLEYIYLVWSLMYVHGIKYSRNCYCARVFVSPVLIFKIQNTSSQTVVCIPILASCELFSHRTRVEYARVLFPSNFYLKSSKFEIFKYILAKMFAPLLCKPNSE